MGNEFKVKGIFADGMVLQRNTTNCAFGTSQSGATVILTFNGSSIVGKADQDGNWKIEFNPGKEGGPYVLSIRSGLETVEFKDVYVGEVWVSSGQSNAQLPMERMRFSYPDEFALPENPGIRMITIPIKWAYDGEKDCVENPTWLAASPENLGVMSGTAYFFAKKLHQELGVPVGIINASQGGSPISAWMNKESLTQLDNTKMFLDQVERFENPENIAQVQKTDAENAEKWNKLLYSTDQGTIQQWEKIPFDEIDYDWGKCTIPGYISSNDSAGFVWLKKGIELTQAQVDRCNEIKTWVWLGTIVDADVVWVNGVKIGETPYCYPPRRYVVPAGTLKAGLNTITVRVQKNNHLGKINFYQEKPYFLFTDDVKICPTAVRNVEKFTEVTPENGVKISLSGEWRAKVGTTIGDSPSNQFFEWVPTALYNAMLAPCFNHAVAGALWYQGESDCWHPDEYRGMLMKMIMLWRQKFVYAAKEMPFVIMQLPGWSDGKSEGYFQNEMAWAQMRQEQLLVTEIVENTGIAITIDAGEWNDLHPEKKRTGGTRAAMEALRIAYGKDISSSPKAIYTARKGESFVVQFDVGKEKLKTLAGNEIPGFYFLYEKNNEQKMIEATGTIISDNEVSVCIPKIDGKFCEIRYLWADCPNPINLYSTNDLPAQAFRAVIPE